MPTKPPKPLPEVLHHPQDVSPEGGPHKGVQEGVDAGVRQRQPLCHLKSPIEALADLAVGHHDINGVHGAAELHHVVRQLSEQEHGHHCQQDTQGTPLSLSLHFGSPTQHPPHPAVAHYHDKERYQEPEEHLQQLQGSLGCSGHAGRIDLRAGHPVMGVLHRRKDELRQAEEAGHGPQQQTH